jgi:hypothetical protein
VRERREETGEEKRRRRWWGRRRRRGGRGQWRCRWGKEQEIIVRHVIVEQK